ncbi:MAG: hypothetical protein DHS20C15_03960 [Planctomycetota bacterium]|nr:MAG: hypothetical protein DHS20C15_03960 [Planctomycetota bacterium]
MPVIVSKPGVGDEAYAPIAECHGEGRIDRESARPVLEGFNCSSEPVESIRKVRVDLALANLAKFAESNASCCAPQA